MDSFVDRQNARAWRVICASRCGLTTRHSSGSRPSRENTSLPLSSQYVPKSGVIRFAIGSTQSAAVRSGNAAGIVSSGIAAITAAFCCRSQSRNSAAIGSPSGRPYVFASACSCGSSPWSRRRARRTRAPRTDRAVAAARRSEVKRLWFLMRRQK